MAQLTELYSQLQDASNRITQLEDLQCKILTQPFSANNNGSRKNLAETQYDHVVPLPYAEIPAIQTGIENRFGDLSSSVITAEHNEYVEAIIPKFKRAGGINYYMITRDDVSQTLKLHHRVPCEYSNECYGVMFNNSNLDSLDVGDVIREGTRVRESSAYDAYGNRMDVVNLPAIYLASDGNMQDSMMISKTASIKMSTTIFKNFEVMLNENNIPLNLYGKNGNIKSFPDIGEHINKDGILFAYRVEKREESLFTQQINMLSKVMMSDKKMVFDGDGIVVDINILCNNPQALQNNKANKQIYEYYVESIEMMENFVRTVDELHYRYINYSIDYDLEKCYCKFKEILDGKCFHKDNTVFSNCIIQFLVIEINPLRLGDKGADRFGGKGVVSKIIPDELMPIDARTGLRIHIIVNQSTCCNRENSGQLFEETISFYNMQLVYKIKQDILACKQRGEPVDIDNMVINPIAKFYSILSVELATGFIEKCNSLRQYDDSSLTVFLSSILDRGYFYISLNSMSDTITLDHISKIETEFPFLSQSYIIGKQKDSNGNYREIRSRRPIECGLKAMYRLKQYSEEKFSATSMSAVNIQGLNTKSKAAKNNLEPYATTPIAIGNMEEGDLEHLGIDYVIEYMMTHSVSPMARRIMASMFTDNPMSIDIKLDQKSKNRNAEIVNVYLLAKGLELVFTKHEKKIEPLVQEQLCSLVKGERLCQLIDKEYFDWEKYKKELFEEDTSPKPVVQEQLVYFDNWKEKLPYSMQMWLDEWGAYYESLENDQNNHIRG